MSEYGLENKWAEIQKIHKREKFTYLVLGGFIAVVLSIVVGGALFTGNSPFVADSSGYSTNLYTELISVIVTIAVLDRLSELREVRRLKKRLLREAKGQANELSKAAIDWIRDEEWLEGEDSILRGAHLWGANLNRAHLYGANLSKSILTKAHLKSSRLNGANLQEANLYYADMRQAVAPGAIFQNADLAMINAENAVFNSSNMINADLRNANLEGADFDFACLQGADLRGANLKGATFTPFSFYHTIESGERSISGEVFNKETTLPDGTKWTVECDIRRFTDPAHPDFWGRKVYDMWNWSGQSDENGFITEEQFADPKYQKVEDNLKLE